MMARIARWLIWPSGVLLLLVLCALMLWLVAIARAI